MRIFYYSISFLIIVAILAYLLFYPIEAELEKWQAPPAPSMSGKYTPNKALKTLKFNFMDNATNVRTLRWTELAICMQGRKLGKFIASIYPAENVRR